MLRLPYKLGIVFDYTYFQEKDQATFLQLQADKSSINPIRVLTGGHYSFIFIITLTFLGLNASSHCSVHYKNLSKLDCSSSPLNCLPYCKTLCYFKLFSVRFDQCGQLIQIYYTEDGSQQEYSQELT